ncbi:putative transcription factor MYB-related family [Helianthus annuus]|nr:putative transcription factor MYB-related family [Helianthus annuus]
MVRPSCCDKINMRKGPWNEEGDGHMLAFVNKQTSNWQVGAPRKPGLRRCGKSCRLRKTSVTRNDNTGHENFTPQEEELIIKLHSAIGSRWPIIAQQLPGRTENDVKNYWNTKLKKKLSSMGIDPVTHRPFSQMLADYGNISGLTRTQTRIHSLGRDIKNTFFVSSDQEIQHVPMETLMFPSFNNDVVKVEPPEIVKTDSLDLLTQLQAITHVKDSPTNQEISYPFHVSIASSSSSSSSTCSTLNETNPKQTFNWREFLIENVQDGNANDEDLNLEVVGEIDIVQGNNNTMSMNGVKETMEEACDGSFVETMLNGDHDMLLDFPGLMGEPSYY